MASGGSRSGSAAHPLAPAGRDGQAAPCRPDQAGDEDRQHEQAAEHDARDEAGEVEVRDRGVGQESEDDQVDRGRDQNAERASGGERAEEQGLIVAVASHQRHRHGADRGRGGDARAGRGGNGDACSDVRVHQSARKPGQPLHHGPVHPLGDARPHHDLAKQNEHRDGDQQDAALHGPRHGCEAPVQRQVAIEAVEEKP